MRVVFWCQSFWPYIGGVELFAMRLLPVLRDRGHEIAVVTSHGSLELPDEDHFTGIAVHRLHFQDALAGGDARLVLKARQRTAAIKRSFQPDLVHLNLQDPSVFFHIHTTRAWPCPTLLTVHGELGDCDAGAGTLLGRALRAAATTSTGPPARTLADPRCRTRPGRPFTAALRRSAGDAAGLFRMRPARDGFSRPGCARRNPS